MFKRNTSMSIYSRNCYTYLIGWPHLNIFYYGSRYGKGVNPSDLWVTYFTSSKYVKEFRKLHGEPDVAQVRKTFGEDTVKCRNHEYVVLRRLNVPRNDKFLNRNTGGGKFSTYGMCVAKSTISGLSIGLVGVNDHRWATGEIVSIHLGKRGIKHRNSSKLKGIKRGTASAIDYYGNSLGLVSIDDIRWSTGEIVSTTLGIKRTDEQRENIKINHADCSGENNSFYGKTHSDETKLKIGFRDYSSISRAILVDGIEYRSVGEANRTLDIPRGIIDRLLVSGKSHELYRINNVIYKPSGVVN